MRLRIFLLLLTGCFLAATSAVRAQAQTHMSSDEMAAEASTLQWKTGTITLRDGLATIHLAPGYRFLDGPDAEKVLHELWGNPPSRQPLGMIFPPGDGPLDHGGFGVLVQYEEGGHVNDADAGKINYTDLLKQMQQSVREANPQRQREGYPTIELAGWAEPPHYDPTTHKLYWAKHLVFNDTMDYLNYDVRVLGRRGVLVLTGVSRMNLLSDVATSMPNIMGMVDFKAGNTYADFDPRVDKVAKYGIAALVAGGALGAAAKLGLLKFMWPLILALKKVIVFVVIGVVAAIKKIMSAVRGRSSVVRPFDPPSHGQPNATPVLNPPPAPNPAPLRPPSSGSGFPPTKSF